MGGSMFQIRNAVVLLVGVSSTYFASSALGDDWSQWRGKDRAGIWSESGVISLASADWDWVLEPDGRGRQSLFDGL
jgi:hypothetical protein